MGVLKKLQKLVEAVNTYYAFALILYAAILYIAGHNKVFLWILACTTPLITGWGGYLLYAAVKERTERYGFKILSDHMNYKVNKKQNNYILSYTTKLLAAADHLMIYPICYQWSGEGQENIPKLASKDQQLLAITAGRTPGKMLPYQPSTVSTEGKWHYWFVAFNPPVHKDNEETIEYSQKFYDKKGTAQPYIYYFVRTSMKELELSVDFPSDAQPASVTSHYIKASDPNRPYKKPGVVYDKDRLRATWTIKKPRRGCYYRIDWQY